MRTPLAAVLGLLVTGSALAVVPSPASAEHTAAPDRVTLVGSLQSELGCAADWAPACAATARPGTVPGTRRTPRTCGAGRQLRLQGRARRRVGRVRTAPTAAAAPTSRCAPARRDAAVLLRPRHATASRVRPGRAAAGEVTAPTRRWPARRCAAPLTRERFYFVMADRFANGDPPTTPAGSPATGWRPASTPTHKGFFHGGDIAGLTDRLDYIEGLGTTAIWLTPSFKNRPVQGAGDQASAGLPRLLGHRLHPDRPALRHQRRARGVHRRGARRGHQGLLRHHHQPHRRRHRLRRGRRYTYVSKEAAALPRRRRARSSTTATYAGGETFPELDAATSFPYTPVFRTEADATVKVPAWLNDPTQLPQPRRLDLRRRVARRTATSSASTTSSPSSPTWSTG